MTDTNDVSVYEELIGILGSSEMNVSIWARFKQLFAQLKESWGKEPSTPERSEILSQFQDLITLGDANMQFA